MKFAIGFLIAIAVFSFSQRAIDAHADQVASTTVDLQFERITAEISVQNKRTDAEARAVEIMSSLLSTSAQKNFFQSPEGEVLIQLVSDHSDWRILQHLTTDEQFKITDIMTPWSTRYIAREAAALKSRIKAREASTQVRQLAINAQTKVIEERNAKLWAGIKAQAEASLRESQRLVPSRS